MAWTLMDDGGDGRRTFDTSKLRVEYLRYRHYSDLVERQKHEDVYTGSRTPGMNERDCGGNTLTHVDHVVELQAVSWCIEETWFRNDDDKEATYSILRDITNDVANLRVVAALANLRKGGSVHAVLQDLCQKRPHKRFAVRLTEGMKPKYLEISGRERIVKKVKRVVKIAKKTIRRHKKKIDDTSDYDKVETKLTAVLDAEDDDDRTDMLSLFLEACDAVDTIRTAKKERPSELEAICRELEDVRIATDGDFIQKVCMEMGTAINSFRKRLTRSENKFPSSVRELTKKVEALAWVRTKCADTMISKKEANRMVATIIAALKCFAEELRGRDERFSQSLTRLMRLQKEWEQEEHPSHDFDEFDDAFYDARSHLEGDDKRLSTLNKLSDKWDATGQSSHVMRSRCCISVGETMVNMLSKELERKREVRSRDTDSDSECESTTSSCGSGATDSESESDEDIQGLQRHAAEMTRAHDKQRDIFAEHLTAFASKLERAVTMFSRELAECKCSSVYEELCTHFRAFYQALQLE